MSDGGDRSGGGGQRDGGDGGEDSVHCCGSCLCQWRQADGGDCQRCLPEVPEVVEATEVTAAEMVFPLLLSLSVSMEVG